jgi:hypothetical protein
MTSANYIIRDGEMLAPPPVTLEIHSLNMFVVGAQAAQLQVLCDEELNHGGRLRYQPVGPFVVFYAANMTNIVPSGRVEEIDIGVWVPVFACEKTNKAYEAKRVLAYTPYLWVDNSPALVGGRLIFGFPKHIGSLEISADRRSFRVETLIMPQQGGTARPARVVEIKVGKVGEVSTEVPGSLVDWKHELAVAYEALKMVPAAALSAKDFWSSLPNGGAQELVAFVMRGHGLPNVFLKQVPSADGSFAAVYQAVLEAPIAVRSVQQKPRKTSPATIRTVHCFSHRIARRLGLVGGECTPTPPYYYEVDSLLAVETAFTAEVGLGRTIWEAPAAL